MKFSTPQITSVVDKTYAIIIVAILMLLAGSKTDIYGQSYYEDWDDGINRHWKVQGGGNPISSKESLSGKYSFRSYLPAVRTKSPRHEIVFNGTESFSNYLDPYQDYSIQFAMYVPSNFKPDNEMLDVFMQIHGRSDENETYNRPPFVLQLHGYNVTAIARYVKRDPGSNSDVVSKLYPNVAKVEKGKWHYFTLEFRIDHRSSGNGYMKVYMKKGGWPSANDRIVNYNGAFGAKDKKGPYAKFGVYKWHWRESDLVRDSKNSGINYRELYYDNIKLQKGKIINGSGKNGSSGTTNDDEKKEETTSGGNTGSSGGVVSAGPDFTISKSEGSFRLTPTFNGDLKPDRLRWKKIKGPAADQTYKGYDYVVSKINVGTYEYELWIEYNGGKQATDRIQITVTDGTSSSGSGSTSGGAVNAGSDFSVSKSKGSFLLEPSFSGSIKPDRLRWKKISGPSASQTYKGYNYLVSSINVGTYEYEVWIEYNGGKTATDRIKINVTSGTTTGSTSSSSTLQVSAGPDQTVALSKKKFVLTPSWANDVVVDGLRWRKISGPSFTGKYIGYPYEVSSIKVGTYVFEVTLTDSKGNKANDRVRIQVVNTSSIASSGEFDELIGNEEELIYGVTRNFISTGEPLELVKGKVIGGELRIMSITGQPVNVGYQNGLLQTARLSPGLYLYNLLDSEGQLVQRGRIIKQ